MVKRFLKKNLLYFSVILLGDVQKNNQIYFQLKDFV